MGATPSNLLKVLRSDPGMNCPLLNIADSWFVEVTLSEQFEFILQYQLQSEQKKVICNYFTGLY